MSKKIKTFPNYVFNRREAKFYLDMTDKEIDKVEKSNEGLLKIISGVGFYLSKRLPYKFKILKINKYD